MNTKRKKAWVLVIIMCLSLGLSTNVEAAGCSNYNLYKKGTAKCTVKQCPGGLKRKERQDKYRQKCVRDNGTHYYNYDYKTVYISCSCP